MKEDLRKLQDEFATIDLFTSNNNSSNKFSDYKRILIKKFLPIKIKMYSEHHNLPHIHIDYGNNVHTASYSIEEGKRLAGNLSKKYDKIVKKWIENNKDKLMKIWEEINSGNNADTYISELT